MRTLNAAIAAIVFAGPALAHSGAGTHGSAVAGLVHPFMGTDHLLAMLGVGLLAAMQARSARWLMPASFVVTVAVGFALGAAGLAAPFVEPVILASVFALAILVTWAARLPAVTGAALMGVFGLAHGTAHGVELGSAEALPYAVGILGATALLHAAGFGLGAVLARFGQASPALRFLGAALGVGALGIALG